MKMEAVTTTYRRPDRKYIILVVVIADILAIVLGLTLTWATSVIPKLEDPDHPDNPISGPVGTNEISLIGSLLSIGGMIGPIFVAFASNGIGRRWTMLCLGIPFFLSFVMFSSSDSIYVFYVARVFAGLSVGASFTMIPNYLTEIAEVSIRGTISSTMNVLETSGELLGQVMGGYMTVLNLSITCAVIAGAYIILFFAFAPETPQYLLKVGKDEQAEKVLRRLRGRELNKLELQQMKDTMEVEASVMTKEFFCQRSNVRALLIMCWLMFFQNATGINVLVTYGLSIFIESKTDISPELGPIAMGIAQVVTCVLTPLFVDKFGRRILLVASATIMCISQVALGIYFYLEESERTDLHWLPMTGMLLYMAGYGLGFCAIPYVVMAELLPSNVSASASAFTCVLGNLINFGITFGMPHISNAWGMSTAFWIFAACDIAAIVYVLTCVPETKGKTVQEIQAMLSNTKEAPSSTNLIKV